MTIPPIQTEDFRGKCPVCSGSLHHDEADETFVICASTPDHYRIEVKKFNAAWETLEKHLQNKRKKPDMHLWISELMSALLTNNVAVNAPPVDPSKFIPSKSKE